MLDWVGLFVTRIDSLDSQQGERIRIIAADGDDDELVITRTGEDATTAFRNCVIEGIRQWPLDERPIEESTVEGPR